MQKGGSEAEPTAHRLDSSQEALLVLLLVPYVQSLTLHSPVSPS